MLTIKEIHKRLQANQTRIDAENHAAASARSRAEEFRSSGDISGAQAHERTAMDHEQRAQQVQHENTQLMQDQERLQDQIMHLDAQRDAILSSKDEELAAVETQIDKIRGGA